MYRPLAVFLSGGLAFGALLLWGAAQSRPEVRPVKAEERLILSIQGPELYKAYCASCHGLDLRGTGPMASSLKVRPTDLTMIAMINGGHFPLARMERIISGEEQPRTGHGSKEMPVWGPIFSQVENDQDRGRVRIDNLTRYIRDHQK